MRLLRRPPEIIHTHLRPYLALNGLVYGLFVLGMGVTVLFPDLQTMGLDPFQGEVGGNASIVDAVKHSVWLFGLTILTINVVPTALVQIALPSLIVPFLGTAVFAFRAFSFGVTLAPTNEVYANILLPHSLTLLIEFQAYILVMLGSYILGKSWIRPPPPMTRAQGYRHGLTQLGWLTLGAAPLFIVGAFYEAYEIIHLIPRVIANTS
ncbi:stage II sporulation protein M [Rhodococcus sp. IEGM 1330]|uniref:stage II sporulation protein M n=1 Tax=Rhodococcus sp. IEGM 1330 TaxID=3082225 RepID=UPI0029552C11|nr:stage II sporulation protein M [Rhodococcus sp. IEGM 1330]MDV8020090.1 stage II sporulation protein M [Rhodococcus sp. IEGM 1330]